MGNTNKNKVTLYTTDDKFQYMDWFPELAKDFELNTILAISIIKEDPDTLEQTIYMYQRATK